MVKKAENAVMVAPTTAPSVDVDTSRVGGVPFLTFISQKSTRFADYATFIPGLKEPDAVLVMPQPEPPVRLTPLKLHLVRAQQYWATIEDDGTVTRVEWNRPESYDPALKEVIEAVVIAYHGDRLIPARMTFKTTKCVGAAAAAKMLKLAEQPKWAEYSPLHAATMQIKYPYGRFTVTFRCSQKTARSTGRKYWQADATITPTTPGEASLLELALQNREFQATAAAVADSFNRRVADMREIAG